MVFPNPKALLPTTAFASSLHSMMLPSLPPVLIPLTLPFFSKSFQLAFFTLYYTKSVPLRPTVTSSFHATWPAACHAADHLLSHGSLLLCLFSRFLVFHFLLQWGCSPGHWSFYKGSDINPSSSFLNSSIGQPHLQLWLLLNTMLGWLPTLFFIPLLGIVEANSQVLIWHFRYLQLSMCDLFIFL